MELASVELSPSAERLGHTTPLVVLHGLYGSSRNWRGVGRVLGEQRRVVALDLPNHGASPRSADCSYPAQAEAVRATLRSLGIERSVLMGHSMGGKVAMAALAQSQREFVETLVLDIGPWRNQPERELLEAMLRMPLQDIGTRGEAEKWLTPHVEDRATLLFLLTNLVRRDVSAPGEPAFQWQLGLEELAKDFDSIASAPLPEGSQVTAPVAFLGGGDSDYLQAGDLPRLRQVFPQATLDLLPGVGHNVHIEGGERFVSWVDRQLAGIA